MKLRTVAEGLLRKPLLEPVPPEVGSEDLVGLHAEHGPVAQTEPLQTKPLGVATFGSMELEAMRSWAVVCVVALGVIVGCGGSDEGDQASGQSGRDRCILLANGNKLCGADAKAYCERFGQDSTDEKTVAACAATGADTTSASEDRRAAEAEEEERQAAENRKKVLAGDDFAPAAKRVLGDDLLVVRVDIPGEVTVETFFRVGSAPKDSKLRRVCSAVQEVEPSVEVVVEADDGVELVTCEPKS